MTLQSSQIPQANDLERILINEERLAQRIQELGREISRDYEGRALVLVSILKGGIVFLADLIRCISIPLQIEMVGASCYRGGVTPHPGVRITKDVDENLAGRSVLLIEDIYDTGHTLRVIYELLSLHGPASLEICALVRKNKTHEQQLDIKYLGFEIEDAYVVGFGLDYKEHYRNLPCIGVLNHALYE